jgi:hypothetical protein
MVWSAETLVKQTSLLYYWDLVIEVKTCQISEKNWIIENYYTIYRGSDFFCWESQIKYILQITCVQLKKKVLNKMFYIDLKMFVCLFDGV